MYRTESVKKMLKYYTEISLVINSYNINEYIKRKKIYTKWKRRGGPGLKNLVFPGTAPPGGEGATLYPKIYNMFFYSDISL